MVVIGSHASDTADEESDLDVLYVFRDLPTRAKERHGRVDLIPTTLEAVRHPTRWFTPALAHARIVYDESGKLAAVVEEARAVARDEVADLYDSYLNDLQVAEGMAPGHRAGRPDNAGLTQQAGDEPHRRARGDDAHDADPIPHHRDECRRRDRDD